MRDFFKSQSDYIYFFYGLAFFFLALICFNLGRSRSRKLPWLLLGLFGIFHGLNEWFSVAETVFGRKSALLVIQIALLTASYLFLFEFARVGFFRLKGKLLPLWVYVPLLFLAFLGLKNSLEGLGVTIRYFLGFVATAFAARVIYDTCGRENEARKPLFYLSMALALYSVATGLVVPRVSFIPANWINSDSFLDAFGFPVQLLRGLLALSSAMALWFYSQIAPSVKFYSRRYLFSFKPSIGLVSVTLAALIGLGWIFTSCLDYYAGIQLIKNSKTNRASSLNKLIWELTRLEQAAFSISRSGQIASVLVSRSGQDIENTRNLLQKFKVKLDALDCFLLDERGWLVISIEPGLGQHNSKDQLYASRAYFRQAMSGVTGYHFTLSSTYDERIYYVSLPVKDRQGEIIGAVVIKKNILVNPIIQYRLVGIIITLFICILAISFFLAWGKRESIFKLIEEANVKLQIAQKSKMDFVSVVSHELRNPLSSIKNAVTLLLKKAGPRNVLGENDRDLLGIILDNTNRQIRLVSDLLDVSKIEANLMDICIESVDIVALTKEVVSSLTPQLKDKELDFILFTERETLTIPVDPEHIRRVLINLITNAIKFTPHRGHIKVSIENLESDIKICVSDSGLGIAQEDIDKLFNKFPRIATASLNKSGVGLGLVISKGLVSAHGGKIWVGSELGRGSSFYFTLPKVKIIETKIVSKVL